MNTKPVENRSAPTAVVASTAAVDTAIPALLVAVLSATAPATAAGQQVGCAASAKLLRFACAADLRDDFFTATAHCLDTAMPSDDCFAAADEAFEEDREECREVLAARLDLCEALDDATHEPSFGIDFSASFVDPRDIGSGVTPNPYFPLVAGNRWVYASEDEIVTVEVTDESKLIDGVRCVTVSDVVTEDDVVIEDTDDWFAQDVDGNVWYCGEISRNFEIFEGDDPEDPELVDIEGSWKHRHEGAEAGMLLPFAPEPGDVIRQEVRYTDAEDVIEVSSVTATEATPGGSCAGSCLQTRDFTPLEPGAEEHKFYAPGIGLILETDPQTGERLELMEFTGVGQ